MKAITLLLLAAGSAVFANTYEIEEIPLPPGMSPELSGLAFTPSGKLVVVNRHGELWITPDAKAGA